MFILTGIVLMFVFFGVDYLVRRKKWKDNTKDEKASLIINLVTIPVYYIMGTVGILFAIVGTTAKTEFGNILFEISGVLSSFTGVIVLIVTIGALILRKKGQVRGSKWIHMGSFIYIMLYAALANLSNVL